MSDEYEDKLRKNDRLVESLCGTVGFFFVVLAVAAMMFMVYLLWTVIGFWILVFPAVYFCIWLMLGRE